MKELIKFELYKVFVQKGIYLTAILLLLIITFFLMQTVGPSLRSLYKGWVGPVTTHDLQTARSKDKVIQNKQDQGKEISWEELKLRNVYSDVLKIGIYKKQQQNDIQHLNKKIESLKNQSGYVYRTLKLKRDMLKKIHFDNLYYYLPVAKMLDFLNTYGFVFLGFLILIGVSPIFTQETASGVDQFMLSSKYGRRTIVHAKIITSFIFVFVMMLISIGYDLIFWSLTEGFSGWHAPIQSMQKFWDSPYSYNLLSFFLLKAGYQVVAGCAFALFAAFVSSVSKNSIVSILVSGFVFAFPIVVETSVHYELPSWLYVVFNFTYTNAMIVDALFRDFRTVNLFGYPVLYPVFALAILIILSFLALFLLYKVMANKQVA